MAVPHKPTGYQTVIPYLVADNAGALIDFMKSAFGCEVIENFAGENGKIMHAEVRIDDSVIMISDSNEKHAAQAVWLHLYLPDVDSVYKKALAAGATSVAEPADQFYGDRSGAVMDKSGNTWWIATHVKDMSMEELQQKAAQAA
jgi:PhnB protein